MSAEGPALVLVGTPLGNRGDLSPRARAAILGVDLLLCEDTRSPARLLGQGVGLPPRLSCFVGNEHDRVATMVAALGEGKRVGFVSEAGLPVWSDPGRLLVQAAVEAGYPVDVVPGPTAASLALCLSGFEPRGARFVGFVPRDGSARTDALAAIATDRGASLLYEAGNRVPKLLRDLAAATADAQTRTVVIARELTKVHQEVRRGTLAALADAVTESLRGEVTIVVQGSPPAAAPELDAAAQAARDALEILLDPALKPRARAKALARLTGLDPSGLYARLTKR